MTSPADVVRFHADFDKHPDDRLRLFRAVRELVPQDATVLYPGSYVDIGPSIWFDDVTYVDVDKRAARFFSNADEVAELIAGKRAAVGLEPPHPPPPTFHHLDYRSELPIADGSVDLLVSLYAGFIGEHCARYLRPGGLLLANPSHGDASLAAIDPAFELVAAVLPRGGDYRLDTENLDSYLQPKRGHPPTAEELHDLNRGIAYTKPAFAYIFANR